MRRLFVVILCSIAISTALGQSNSEFSQANAMRHRMNVQACGMGLSTCDPSLLTGTEKSAADVMRHRMNVQACGIGLSTCDPSLLTGTEKSAADAMRHRMNVQACGMGLSTCDPSLLTGTENSSPGTAAGTVLPATPPSPNPVAVPPVGENGSYYGELNKNGVPKTVHVSGYYRRDGTYVRGHYRSAPGTNPRCSHR